MRKRKCPEPGCYGGTIWNDQGDDRPCPRCGGVGMIDDLQKKKDSELLGK